MSMKPDDWEFENKKSEFDVVDDSNIGPDLFLEKASYFAIGFFGYIVLEFLYSTYPLFGVSLQGVVYGNENLLFFLAFPFIFEAIILGNVIRYLEGKEILSPEKSKSMDSRVLSPSDPLYKLGEDD